MPRARPDQSPERMLEVGAVTRPHGLRGDVKVRLHWAESDALDHVQHVTLVGKAGEPTTYLVESSRPVPRGVLLKLKGVDNPGAAEALRGALVSVRRAELPAGDGEFYLVDLIGARVVSGDRLVGTVVEVRTHPTVDSIVIERPDGQLVEQPLLDPWIHRVDVAADRIELASTDGLIE